MKTASITNPGLRRLEVWLTAETAPPDRMSLSLLDGTLTALAIGPDIGDRDPLAWQSAIVGGHGPGFASDAAAAAIQAALGQGLPAPIHDGTDGGDEPCPGGSGKKLKKCCAA